MGKGRARKRSAASFRRQEGDKSGRRILIVCEGRETEPGYSQALKNERKLGAVVVIEGEKCGSAPISVVDWAIEEKERAESVGKPYDEVWCVFDRDQHESFARAINKARDNGLQIAPSVPSFEFWILLHFCYTTRPFKTCDRLLKEIEPRCPGHSKSKMDWDSLRPNRETAKQHARRIAEQNINDTAHPNPSTRVHELVEFLERL